MSNPILRANAAKIAEKAGGAIKDQYDNKGLVCYREEFELTPGGQVMVREGYIRYEELPNGSTIASKVTTAIITREQAERE